MIVPVPVLEQEPAVFVFEQGLAVAVFAFEQVHTFDLKQLPQLDNLDYFHLQH